MSAATASIADFKNKNDQRNNSAHSQAQCTPMPLPALGTQRIIQGNGTNVGTVISLQCPANHKLIGKELMCVMDINSTHWVGETYCKPASPFEDYGFRVAVLASIISSGIILFMSVAFITCCLLDCIKEDERKKQERESDVWQWEEQPQHQGDNRSRYSHKGRNNNNNNKTQEKMLSLWDNHSPALCDDMRAYRCHQHYAYGPACTYDPPLPHAPLPGVDYDQPLLPRNQESAESPGPPPYQGPSLSSCQTLSTSLVQISAVGSGLVWQYGGQQSSLSGAIPSTTDESNPRNINSAKEFSIRIISV
ncbi:uncharacterized protein LOC133988119 [Scomber scombrus]|uniref:uncharacterized protein LOC133988119 n=1 Tax=Scomber scombrus TaxID=13677 RepID=UPI002DDAB2BE|nr:uncharacterized protein LOC133988119 [Scomber scombrus]